jgi:hypothetical protein
VPFPVSQLSTEHNGEGSDDIQIAAEEITSFSHVILIVVGRRIAVQRSCKTGVVASWIHGTEKGQALGEIHTSPPPPISDVTRSIYHEQQTIHLHLALLELRADQTGQL